MAMLEVRDLSVNYGVIQAVKNVSFEINQGEIVTLMELMVPANQLLSRRFQVCSSLRAVRFYILVKKLNIKVPRKSSAPAFHKLQKADIFLQG